MRDALFSWASINLQVRMQGLVAEIKGEKNKKVVTPETAAFGAKATFIQLKEKPPFGGFSVTRRFILFASFANGVLEVPSCLVGAAFRLVQSCLRSAVACPP